MFNLIPWRKHQPSTGVTPYEASPLVRLRQEFDSLFDHFLGNWPAPLEGIGLGRFWAFEVDETDQELIVRAEMPGFDANDLDVHVSGQVLSIKAEKKREQEGDRDNGHFAERHYAAFRRTVTLPAGVDADKIEARYRNGVLEVHVPKTDEAKGKRISVKE